MTNFNVNLAKFVEDVRTGLNDKQNQFFEQNSRAIISVFFEAAKNDNGTDDNMLENTTDDSYKALLNKAIAKIKDLHKDFQFANFKKNVQQTLTNDTQTE